MQSHKEALITPNKTILPPLQNYSRNSCSPHNSSTSDIYEPQFFDNRLHSRVHHIVSSFNFIDKNILDEIA